MNALSIVVLLIVYVIAMDSDQITLRKKGPFLWDLNESASSNESSIKVTNNDHKGDEITSNLKSLENTGQTSPWGSKKQRSTVKQSSGTVWGSKKGRSGGYKSRQDLSFFQLNTQRTKSSLNRVKQTNRKPISAKEKEKWREYFRLRKKKEYRELSIEARKALNAKRYQYQLKQFSRLTKKEKQEWKDKKKQLRLERKEIDDRGQYRVKQPRLFKSVKNKKQ